MAATAILGDVDVGTLTRSLAIAVLLVLPYGAVKWRQVRKHRLAVAAASAPPEPTPAGPTLESVVDAIAGLDPRTGGEVDVPDGCTVDGRAVDATVAEVLLIDALTRSGMRIGSRQAVRDGVRLHCVPVAGWSVPEPHDDGTDRGADGDPAARP